MNTPTRSYAALTLDRRAVLARRAQYLAGASVAYNTVEAIVAVLAGQVANSAALLGFGLDSTVEVASGLVILWQFRHPLPESREQTAGRLIGAAFFALAAFVTFEAVTGLAAGQRPESSLVGIALACASVAIMPILSVAQRRTGRELGSSAVHADGTQTLLCTYLSVVLLVGLLANTTLGWWWFDAIAALIIAALALREGTQAWRGQGCCAPATPGPVTPCSTENLAPARHTADTPETRQADASTGPAATVADLSAAGATVVYTAVILVLLGVRSWQQ